MKHIINYLSIALLGLTLTNCNADFGDLNKDPNKVTKVGTDNLFHNVVGTLSTPSGEMKYFAPMMQYTATTNGNYDIVGNTFTVDGTAMGVYSSIWRSYCVDYLRYINLMDDQLAEETASASKQAQVDIVRALVSSRYTDTFGPVPYDEGGKALDGISYPVYRTEKEIYLGTDKFKGLLQMLDEGIQTLKNSSDPIFEDDILYGGNRDKWIKFGSSLLLRMAIQLSNVEPELAKTYVNKAVQAGVISSMDEVAKVNHQPTVTGQPSYLDNTWATDIQYYIGSRGYCYSNTYITAFKKYSASQIDPRLKYVAAVYDGEGKYYSNYEDYEGMKNGCEMDDVDDVLKEMTFDEDFAPNIGRYGFASFKKETILNRKGATTVMGAAEVYFLLAEAVLKGYIPGTADTYYREGIRQGMRSLTLIGAPITDEEIESYISTVPALGENKAMNLRGALDEVITQKWLALFGNGLQIWNDWRRTHYPSAITDNPNPSKLSVTNGKMIGRLPYPQDEMVRNEENYLNGTAGLSNKTNDYMNDIWWALPYYK